jgi:hypothetical protein
MPRGHTMRTRRLHVAPPLFFGSLGFELDAIAPTSCDTTLENKSSQSTIQSTRHNDTPKRVSGGTWSAAVSYSETLVTAGWSLFMMAFLMGTGSCVRFYAREVSAPPIQRTETLLSSVQHLG